MAQLLIGTIFFDAEKRYMYVILRTISSYFPHQKILFLSKVMPVKIYDTSPRLSILLLIKRGHIYIYLFRSVPVWQKNNMSLTPVSQANYQNFCPKQFNFKFG